MFSTNPSDDAGLNYYTLVTLVDITKTDVVHLYSPGVIESESDYNAMRNQQRNYQTVLQVIGLRCQPMYIGNPVMHSDEDLAAAKLGTNYTKGNVWTFNFGVEQEDVFALPDRPNGLLLDDLHNVPIVLGLTENVGIKLAMIDTVNSATRNTIILK